MTAISAVRAAADRLLEETPAAGRADVRLVLAAVLDRASQERHEGLVDDACTLFRQYVEETRGAAREAPLDLDGETAQLWRDLRAAGVRRREVEDLVRRIWRRSETVVGGGLPVANRAVALLLEERRIVRLLASPESSSERFPFTGYVAAVSILRNAATRAAAATGTTINVFDRVLREVRP